MDKNIVAFVRNDTKTVVVRFVQNAHVMAQANNKDSFQRMEKSLGLGADMGVLTAQNKNYTYITNLDLSVGDIALVFVGSAPIAVVITEVHDGLEIEPNDTREYKWIAAKVDLSGYEVNMEKNKAIMDTVTTAYKNNAKRSFRELLFAELNDTARQQLLEVIGGEKK